MFSVVKVKLLPYRRDIRPDIQCRLLHPKSDTSAAQAEIDTLSHRVRESLVFDEVE